MGVKYGKRKKISMMYYHIRSLQLYMGSHEKLRRTSESFWIHLLLKQKVLDEEVYFSKKSLPQKYCFRNPFPFIFSAIFLFFD